MTTTFEQWVTRLRLAWMRGSKARAIWGGFGAVFDRSVAWAQWAVIEHLPLAASAPSVALTASERGIDQGPAESTQDLAVRVTKAIVQWGLAGTPAGLLCALYYAGFPTAVMVQQNGWAFSLTTPLPGPEFAQAYLVRTQLGPCPQVWGTQPLAQGATSWWLIDATSLDALGRQFNSRFQVIVPGPLDATALLRLRRAISQQRGGAKLCAGIVAITTGACWDWPTNDTWDGDSTTWNDVASDDVTVYPA